MLTPIKFPAQEIRNCFLRSSLFEEIGVGQDSSLYQHGDNMAEMDAGANMVHTTEKEVSETDNQLTGGQNNTTGEVAEIQQNEERTRWRGR